MNKIDVVIVNWNAGLYLQECVESVIQYGNDLVNKIVVVDNSSDDNSLLVIRKFTEVVLIENLENLGFSKGCNIGAKICSSEYILFLNPDAKVYEDTLSDCVNFLNESSNQSTGVLGIPLEDADGVVSRCCARFPSISNVIVDSLGLAKLFSSLGKSMKEWDHSSTRAVDQVIGAFFLVRRSVYKKLNGFDERFFVYFEEVDFSYRAKKEGYKSTFYSGAKAFHYGGISTGYANSRSLFFSLRSRVQYFYKHFSLLSTLFVLFITLFIEFPARLFHAIFVKKSYTSITGVIKAYCMFLFYYLGVNKWKS